MEDESIWRSKVHHDSERDVVLRGGPCASFGGAEVAAHRLSDKLASEAQVARRKKIAAGMAALRQCHTKTESADVLATLYELGLAPTERAPLIVLLYERGLSQDEIVRIVWHVEEGPCYEQAMKECEKGRGTAETVIS